MSDAPLKVFIRNLACEYLAEEGGRWHFTSDRTQAHVFDYHADEVESQLKKAQLDHGTLWVAYPIDTSLLGERCDACGQELESLDVIFDGSRFLCPACFSPSI